MHAREDLVVHIMTGRDAEFLRSHFGAYSRFVIIAEHQRRIAGRFSIWPASSQDNSEWKPAMKEALCAHVAGVAGSHLEEKATSLVWHYREVEDTALAESMADALVGLLEGLKVSLGVRDLKIWKCSRSKLVEAACQKESKGAVLTRFCGEERSSATPFEGVLVARDDISDESMFEAALENAVHIHLSTGEQLAHNLSLDT